LKTFITLDNTKLRELPESLQSDDNRYSESLVEYFLALYTKPGDIVLDMFVGLGTTLFVAEKMGRIPYGIEYDEKRYKYVRSHLVNKENLRHGDSRNLSTFNLPEIDFSMTSPPYMMKEHAKNALTAYTQPGTYHGYLDELQAVFTQLKPLLKWDAHVVVEISNLRGNGITTLAWDVERVLSRVLRFEGEVVIGWRGEDEGKGTYGHGYDHSYCLVFTNSE
jgi:DNA modification methylase